MKKKFPTTGLLVIVAVIAAVVFLVRHFTINDFCVIEPDVLYASDQPRGMDYTRLLYRYHIASIVNVRHSSEHRERNWHNEEITWTRSNGVGYFELPIDRTDYFPDAKTQEDFFAIMADKANLPVLLHGTGDDERTAMLVAVWLARSQNADYDQTLDAVKKIIDDRELRPQELDFIRRIIK